MRKGLLIGLAVLQLGSAFPLGAGGREEYDPILGLSRRSGAEEPEEGTVDVFSRLNVRDGPGTEYGIIGKLYPGEKLKIVKTENGWHQIQWNGRLAWVCAYWVHSKGEEWNNRGIRGGGSPGSRPPAGTDGASDRPADGARPEASGPLSKMPLINQNTGGGSYPGSYCGPTSVRMVLAYYGISSGADQIALRNYGPGTPMYRPGMGSTHQGMSSALRHFGLNTNLTYSHSIAALRAAIQKGHPVIINLRGNYGPFSTAGHISPVVGVTAGGDVILNDSAGGVRRTIPASVFMRTWNGLMLEVWK